MRSRGILTFVVLAVAASAALTGCDPVVPSSTAVDWQALGASVATQTPDPASGNESGSMCSQFVAPMFETPPLLPTGNRVACTQPFQAFTFQTIDLEGGASSPPAGTTEEGLDEEAIFGCGPIFANLLPAAASNHNSRIQLGVEVEPQSSWGTGPLWARCDIVELQIGSSFATPTFAAIQQVPDTLIESAKVNPSSIQICINTPVAKTTNGPVLDSNAVLANCSSAQWKLQPSPDFPDPKGEPYPGGDKLESSFMHAHCGALYDTASVRAWVFYPNSAQWAAGSRSFECWTGKR